MVLYFEKKRPGHLVQIVKQDSEETTIRHFSAHNKRVQKSNSILSNKNFRARYAPSEIKDPADEQNERKLPVMIGDKIIGWMIVDHNQGSFVGKFDQEFIDIITDGLPRGILSMSFIGWPVSSDIVDVQERFRKYLEKE